MNLQIPNEDIALVSRCTRACPQLPMWLRKGKAKEKQESETREAFLGRGEAVPEDKPPILKGSKLARRRVINANLARTAAASSVS